MSMKFSCDKAILCEVLGNVGLAVSSKSSLLALEGILFQCSGNALTLTGYNLDLGIKKTIEVEGLQSGELILDASRVTNIVNKMPQGRIYFEVDDKLLTVIRCQNVEFTILGLSTEDYPEMPAVSEDQQFSIPIHDFKDLVSQTLFAIAQTEQTPVYTGSLFDIEEGCLTLVSVDGYRMALKKQAVNLLDNRKFVVPGKTLSEIQKLLAKLQEDDEDPTIDIRASIKHIIFNICGYNVISRLLEGDFLDYKNAIPKGFHSRIKVSTRDFLDSINRASIIITERAKSPIRCAFEGSVANLYCETSLGKFHDSFLIQPEGEDVTVGFNNKYMADALKASGCDEVVLELNGPLSPIKVLPVEGDDFLFLVLPIRLKD